MDTISGFSLAIDGADDDLYVVSLQGREGLSTLFDFTLELSAESPTLDPASFIGKPALLTIEGLPRPRFIHAMVSRFVFVRVHPKRAIYSATLQPELARLRHREDCRIFQRHPTDAIIQVVLDEAGIPSDRVRFELLETYEPRTYCVQYRESDLAFISRLMEEDGIYYFFEHAEDGHTVVFGDRPETHPDIESVPEFASSVPFHDGSGVVPPHEHIKSLHLREQLVTGAISLRDFNYIKPDMSMEVARAAESFADLEAYDYPGRYEDPGSAAAGTGDTRAKIALESQSAAKRTVQGTSACKRLIGGHAFTLVDHPREDLNARYVLAEVLHRGRQPYILGEDAGGLFSYENSFRALPAEIPFRPPRRTPKPIVHGVQTAVVVGPPGEEIYTDEHGRVKAQFHWDKDGRRNENSSCWIRVAQTWAGPGWGALYLPRIGHEVVVDFIEGDPDRPIITGSVYNGLNRTPSSLPEHKTRSTLRSDSSLGSGGHNELRFEDLKGAEQILMHAERNCDVHVKNDMFQTVLANRHHTTVADYTESVNGNASLSIGVDQTEQVGRDAHRTVVGKSVVAIQGDRHQTTSGDVCEAIQGDANLAITGDDNKAVMGGQNVAVGGDVISGVAGNKIESVLQTVNLTVGAALNEVVGGTRSMTLGGLLLGVSGCVSISSEGQAQISANKIVLEAKEGLSIAVGGNLLTINSSGVHLEGATIKLNCGASALSLENDEEPSPAAVAAPASPRPPMSPQTPNEATRADTGA